MLYPKSILLVEDHDVVRLGTSLLLKEITPAARILQTRNFEEAKEITQHEMPDLVLLDINIPGGGNAEMVSILKAKSPKTRILIFSGYDEQVFGMGYIHAGAAGYLNKNANLETFKLALHKVMSDERYISEGLKERYINEIINQKDVNANPIARLSSRELDVARLLVRGAATAEIANALGLQQSTVSTYKMRIYEKLKVSNVIDLAAKMNLYHVNPA